MERSMVRIPRQAIILVGGLGSRLGALTKDTPKPLLDIAGRPFLDYMVTYLKRQGLEELVLCMGYRADRISEFLGDGTAYGLEIRCVVEEQPAGTGGALMLAAPLLREQFFVINGDTIFDIQFAGLATCTDSNAMALRKVSDVSRFGRVSMDNRKVVGFEEKSGSGEGFINGGVLWLKKQALELLPAGQSSLEKDLLPLLATKNQLQAYCSEGYFIDIGLPETLALAQIEIPAWERKPIAFLDRDGVLNVDHGHVHRIEDFNWMPGARDAVRLLNESGYYVVLVTNQVGIARGYYTEADFHRLTEWMQDQLWLAGAHLDAVYYCPFHPNAPVVAYRKHSDSRKPGPGMLTRAYSELPSLRQGSFFIGDKDSDAVAALAAGTEFHHFNGGNLVHFVRRLLTGDKKFAQTEDTSMNLKKALRSFLHRFGIDVHRPSYIPKGDAHEIIRPVTTFAPWRTDLEFAKTYDLVSSRTLVDEYRLWELWHLMGQVRHLHGGVAEIGVWRGGSGALIAQRAKLLNMDTTVYLCDTFSGVVKATTKDTCYHGGEHADVSYDETKSWFELQGLDNARFLKGIFPEDTGDLLEDRWLRFVHIDVDVYESARDVVEFLWDRVCLHGVLVFDDYGFESCSGIRLLVDELSRRTNNVMLHNLNGHAILVKTGN